MDEFHEENRLEIIKDNEWGEIDWTEVNSGEREESIWDDINWNDAETGEREKSIWSEINWEESESEKQTESDFNDLDGEPETRQSEPNEGERDYEGNGYEQYEMENDENSNYDPYEYGDIFEQEEFPGGFYENSYAEAMNSILLSENQIYEYLREYIALMGEKENKAKQGEQAEVDNLKEEVSEMEKFLEKERERIRLEQQQADLGELIETEPKSELLAKDEVGEQEQKEEVDTQINFAEENFSINKEELKLNLVEIHQANLEETIECERKTNEEVVENQDLKPEELHSESIDENIEDQEYILKLDNDENEKFENYQVETKIKEKFEIDSELIVDGEEYKEHNEEQEYEVLEEFENSQQELEEILVKVRIIEQQYLLEIERKEKISNNSSNENYERAKELYHQITGKRPIYANKETKGFKEWLVQNNYFRGPLKVEQAKEQEVEQENEEEVEQENEEEWISFLNNWINEESGEEISHQIKNQVHQIIEKYSELEELTFKFQELYQRKELKQLSQSEKMELKTLIRTLQKSDPSNVVLFTNLRALKRVLIQKKLNKAQLNKMLNHLFTRFSPIKQLNKILKFQKENLWSHEFHNNRWLTDKIQNYLKNIDSEVKYLFKEYIAFSRMSLLFGLNKNYLREQRSQRNSKNIIALSVLNKMRINFSQKIKTWIINTPSLRWKLLKIKLDILQIIQNYETLLDPLPRPHYQMFKHHPNFKREYFLDILTPEQAYWLGFLFADGFISIEHKNSGDYFRMGIGISEKDYDLLVRFCKAIGLNTDNINTYMDYCSYTDKRTPISRIRWGDQRMAKNLMDLGMEYEFDAEKGRRVKNPNLPKLNSEKLMYCFLLGFYDGDGSLGLTIFRGKSRVLPSIISSNQVFLQEIKKYYNINSRIHPHSYEKFNFRKKKVVKTECFKLYLGNDLFRKMLNSYGKSLKRKTISIELLDKQSLTSQRYWLRKILLKEELQKISYFLSAHKIGKLLSIDHKTIISFAREEYSIKFKPGGYYTTINNSIRWRGKESPYYENFSFWEKFLTGLGKFAKN